MSIYRDNLESNGFDVNQLDRLCDEIRNNLRRYGISLDRIKDQDIDDLLYKIHCYRFYPDESITRYNYRTITNWESIKSMDIDESLIGLCDKLLPSCKQYKEEERYISLIVRAVLEKRLHINADIDGIVSGIYHYRISRYQTFFDYRRISYSIKDKILMWRGLPILFVILSIIAGLFFILTFNKKLPGEYWKESWPLLAYTCVFPLLFYCFGQIDDEKKARKSISTFEFGLSAINLLVLCILVIWCFSNYVKMDISSGLGFAYASICHLVFGFLSLFFAKRFGFLLSLPNR